MRSRKRKPPDCATAGEATDVYKVYTWSRSCGVGTYICMRRYQRHGLLDVADTRMAVSFDVDSVNSMLWPAVHPPSDPPTLAHYSDRRPLATLPLNRPDLLRPPRVIITGPCLILDLPSFISLRLLYCTLHRLRNSSVAHAKRDGSWTLCRCSTLELKDPSIVRPGLR